MPWVTGTTRLLGVIGDPVAQVKAPALLNPIFAALRKDMVLVPFHISPDDLMPAVTGLQRLKNLDGLLVTVPHKFAIRAAADNHSRMVKVTGSANALRRQPDGTWLAENFDAPGFIAGLKNANWDIAGRHVSLIGAGGAGSAIAAAVLEAGCARLSVCDANRDRAQALEKSLGQWWPREIMVVRSPALADADIAVNATPLGLQPHDPLPFDPAKAAPGCLIVEIIMEPRETKLLRRAAELGFPIHHGHHMLDHQVPLYREFFGLPADH